MCGMGSTLGLWEPAVLVLHFIASTALLSFLSSVSKCQSPDSDLILPVDVCVCIIAFSCCICESACIFLRLRDTFIHLRTLSSCLHACQVVRVCCCRALICDVKQNWMSVLNYNKILRFMSSTNLSTLAWNDKKHNPLFVFSFHTVCNRSYRQYFIYCELYLHPVCAHCPQPASLHFSHCCYSNFAFTHMQITSTHNPLSPLLSASETCWWSILLFLLTSGLFSHQLRRALIITEKYKSSL